MTLQHLVVDDDDLELQLSPTFIPLSLKSSLKLSLKNEEHQMKKGKGFIPFKNLIFEIYKTAPQSSSFYHKRP